MLITRSALYIASQASMSGRMEFAAMAMQGFAAANCFDTTTALIKGSVIYADALLAELEKNKDQP